MKIHLVVAELFHADERRDGRTERHDEASSLFRNFAKAPKKNASTDTASASLSAVNINEQIIRPDVHKIRHQSSFKSCRANAIVKNGAVTVTPY